MTRTLAIALHLESDNDLVTWALSASLSVFLYAAFLGSGLIVWNLWKDSKPLDLHRQESMALSAPKQDVIEQIRAITLKKKVELQLESEREASRLQGKEAVAIKQTRSLEKHQEVDVQKKAGLAKTAGARAQNQKVKISYSDLLARSKSIMSQSEDVLAQAPSESKVFDLKPIAEKQNEPAPGKLLQMDRLSGATYDGGLAAHTSAPEGLIFRPSPKEWEIRGGLPLELIQMVVAEHEVQLRYCYELQLLRTPELQGEVLSQWVILSSGEISKIQFESDAFRDSDIFSCLEKKMATWKFPKPEGGGIVSVKYPMRFSKKEAL